MRYVVQLVNDPVARFEGAVGVVVELLNLTQYAAPNAKMLQVEEISGFMAKNWDSVVLNSISTAEQESSETTV